MNELVRSYREYYREQTPRSVDALFDAMLDYDYSSYHEDMSRVLAMWREARRTGDAVRLSSNGSTTGTPRAFDFSPHFRLWRFKVEPFLRGMESKTIMVVAQLGFGALPRFGVSEDPGSSQKHFDAVGNWFKGEDLESLFGFVEEASRTHGPVNLYAMPDVWTCLVTNPHFVGLAGEHGRSIRAFVNGDFDAHFRRVGFYVRDQMVDWGSGLNFFDCEAGTRHFLPIFHFGASHCVNLLNLHRAEGSSDDLVLFEGRPSVCRCGRPYFPARVMLHHRHLIVGRNRRPVGLAPLYQSLSARYASLQFHQDESDRVTALFTSIGDVGDDPKKIADFFGEFGLEMSFTRDKYYSIGRKRFGAWRSPSVALNDFLLPKETK